jgi:hypothetical protein
MYAVPDTEDCAGQCAVVKQHLAAYVLKQTQVR